MDSGDIATTSLSARLEAPVHLWHLAPHDVPARGARFVGDWITDARFEDPVALAVQAYDGSIEIEQLSPGTFAATAFSLPLGPMLVSGVMCNVPIVLRTVSPRDRISILLPGSPDARLFIHGREVSSEHCVLLTGDAGLELVCEPAIHLITITMGAEMWLSECSDHEVARAVACRGVQLRRPGSEWTTAVRSSIDTLRARDPCAPAESSRDLSTDAARLLACVRDFPKVATAAGGHTVRRRTVAVERARAFIHRNLVSPLRVSIVCAETGVQARTLEYGFRELLGMSPVAYIKALRLNRVRRLLLSPGAERRTITEVALDCGFCHLSQFAADYQKFFGESPSAARRRAMAARLFTSPPTAGAAASRHGAHSARRSMSRAIYFTV